MKLLSLRGPTMPSLARLTLPPIIAPLLLAGDPSSLGAQQLVAETAVPIRIIVRPLIAIRGIVATPLRLESSAELTSAIVVNVESNLPYRLTVRPAPGTSGQPARVFVRGASGAFEQLHAGAVVTAAVSDRPGARSHEIMCRTESAIDRCPLVVELSAEHQETLLRSTATVPSGSNAEFGMRTASVPRS